MEHGEMVSRTVLEVSKTTWGQNSVALALSMSYCLTVSHVLTVDYVSPNFNWVIIAQRFFATYLNQLWTNYNDILLQDKEWYLGIRTKHSDFTGDPIRDSHPGSPNPDNYRHYLAHTICNCVAVSLLCRLCLPNNKLFSRRRFVMFQH